MSFNISRWKHFNSDAFIFFIDVVSLRPLDIFFNMWLRNILYAITNHTFPLKICANTDIVTATGFISFVCLMKKFVNCPSRQFLYHWRKEIDYLENYSLCKREKKCVLCYEFFKNTFITYMVLYRRDIPWSLYILRIFIRLVADTSDLRGFNVSNMYYLTSVPYMETKNWTFCSNDWLVSPSDVWKRGFYHRVTVVL